MSSHPFCFRFQHPTTSCSEFQIKKTSPPLQQEILDSPYYPPHLELVIMMIEEVQILNVPAESRKTIEAYQERDITPEEQREQLERYWLRKIHKGTKAPIMESGDVPETMR